MWRTVFHLAGQIPFVGKYKRQLGAALTIGGLVVSATGDAELGTQIQQYGVAVLGLGVAHAEIKEKPKER